MMSAPSMGELSMYLLRKSPYNVKVQESQAFAAPTILYEPKSSSARAYVDFTQEVLGHGRKEQVYERDEDARDR